MCLTVGQLRDLPEDLDVMISCPRCGGVECVDIADDSSWGLVKLSHHDKPLVNVLDDGRVSP